MEEKLHFKVSSGLKDIIGQDLITNELVAIFELVKNGYDADATEINLVINSYEDYILIQDNGVGMNRVDVKNKWLFVAHSDKKTSERVYAGSKGIGRFSCDRLGERLILLTKRDQEVSELEINWGEFEKDSLKRFEDLNVIYRSENVSTSNLLSNTGTTLKISGLRDKWDKDRVTKVISALQRLVNPFVDDGKIKINVKYISSFTGIAEVDEDVSNNVATILDRKTIYIECIIDQKNIKVTLFDKEKIIYSFDAENSTILKNIYFKVYYLSTAAKNNFTRIMGTEAKNYGSIFLYKNNFRIFPYGEVDYDAFGLNLRKTQGYNRYLGHRELLGWINIIDNENHFNEVTSRDRGFVTNQYTIAFENLYMELIQRPLESYVQLVKFGNSDIDDIETDDGEVIDKLLRRFNKFDITQVSKYELPAIAQPLKKKFALLEDESISSKDKKEIQKNLQQATFQLNLENREVKKENRKIDKENQRLKREITIKEAILEKDKPDRQDLLFHELSKVGDELDDSIETIVELIEPQEEFFKKQMLKQIANLRRSSDKLISIKTQILRITNQSLSDTITIDLKEYLKNYFDIVSEESNARVTLNIDNMPVFKSVNVYDLGVLLDNLLLNAVERRRDVEITIYFTEDDRVFHFISNTGPITISPADSIFNLGVTSKANGTGIGMYLCREICEEFGWSINVSSEGDLVDFKIEFGDEK